MIRVAHLLNPTIPDSLITGFTLRGCDDGIAEVTGTVSHTFVIGQHRIDSETRR